MIERWLRQLKYFWQRGRRGYGDDDLWSFDSYLAEMLPKALRQLAKEKHGCPAEYYDDKAVGDESHKWREELERMAQGFESAQHIIANDSFAKFANRKNDQGYEHFKENEEEHYKRLHYSIDALKKNFFGLWD